MVNLIIDHLKLSEINTARTWAEISPSTSHLCSLQGLLLGFLELLGILAWQEQPAKPALVLLRFQEKPKDVSPTICFRTTSLIFMLLANGTGVLRGSRQ